MKLVSLLFEAFCGSHLESDVDRCSDARRNLVLPVPSSPLGGAGPHVSTLGALGVAKGILTPSWMVIYSSLSLTEVRKFLEALPFLHKLWASPFLGSQCDECGGNPGSSFIIVWLFKAWTRLQHVGSTVCWVNRSFPWSFPPHLTCYNCIYPCPGWSLHIVIYDLMSWYCNLMIPNKKKYNVYSESTRLSFLSGFKFFSPALSFWPW